MNIKTRKLDIVLNNKLIKKDFEVPEEWSDTAALIMAEKYATNEENSALDVIDRIVNQITQWGWDQDYFELAEHQKKFTEKLRDILINQRAAFNSPVWFNVGVKNQHQQIAACFIGDVEDEMEDILEHTKRAGMIFKSGSGIGLNISKLRANGELLSNKGKTSGPLSFMRAWDRTAQSIKSGGKNRRSAVLIGLDVNHPDIEEFIECKSKEEEKAKALIAAGYSAEEAYTTVDFQNANHSVIVTDEFMQIVKNEGDWSLINRGDGTISKTIEAKELFNKIATQAWQTGDPGLQFITEANRYNSLANRGRILSSNVCGEVFLPPWGACNLCSLNLVKYLDKDNNINNYLLSEDINILITAMDIMIDKAYYPDDRFRKEAIETRPLGLGITNLGAYLIKKGLAYNSEKGRSAAKEILSYIVGYAINISTLLAKQMGSFSAFEENKGFCFNHYMHLIENAGLQDEEFIEDLKTTGIRNSNLTCLAPTGTIALLMDADTFGIEPLYALESTKTLSGGGTFTLIPECVKEYNQKVLGVAQASANADPRKFAKNYKDPVLLTANEISWQDHIKMLAELQKVICMSASKTINMPSDATVDDVKEAYMMAWELGLKGITVYRDGSKEQQPLTDATKADKSDNNKVVETNTWAATRLKLDEDCESIRHKFNIGGFKGYIHIGLYEDGTPGEIFIRASKNGSFTQALLDCFATSLSLGLQYGIPLETIVDKFKGQQFQPNGITTNEDIRMCSSIVDYIAKYLENQFIKEEETEERINIVPPSNGSLEGPPCLDCGGPTTRVGTCFYCTICGSSTGCN